MEHLCHFSHNSNKHHCHSPHPYRLFTIITTKANVTSYWFALRNYRGKITHASFITRRKKNEAHRLYLPLCLFCFFLPLSATRSHVPLSRRFISVQNPCCSLDHTVRHFDLFCHSLTTGLWSTNTNFFFSSPTSCLSISRSWLVRRRQNLLAALHLLSVRHIHTSRGIIQTVPASEHVRSDLGVTCAHLRQFLRRRSSLANPQAYSVIFRLG